VTRITCNLNEDQCTFIIISKLISLRIRIFLHKTVEKIKPHIVCSINFSGNPAVYESKWKNMVETEGLQIKI
jgi:hypothetical protein